MMSSSAERRARYVFSLSPMKCDVVSCAARYAAALWYVCCEAERAFTASSGVRNEEIGCALASCDPSVALSGRAASACCDAATPVTDIRPASTPPVTSANDAAARTTHFVITARRSGAAISPSALRRGTSASKFELGPSLTGPAAAAIRASLRSATSAPVHASHVVRCADSTGVGVSSDSAARRSGVRCDIVCVFLRRRGFVHERREQPAKLGPRLEQL